jgi:hypothetical protein
MAEMESKIEDGILHVGVRGTFDMKAQGAESREAKRQGTLR